MTGWRNRHSNPPNDFGDRKICRELAEGGSNLPPNARAKDTIQGIKICALQYGDTKALVRHRKTRGLVESLKNITEFQLIFLPIASYVAG